MKKVILNTVKVIILPLVVYVLFVVLSGGKFGNTGSLISIARQTVLPVCIAWAILNTFTMGIWDFSPGAVICLAGIIAGHLTFGTNTGIFGLILFSVIIASLCSLCVFVAYHYLKIPSIIASLGLLMVFETLTATLYNGGGVKISGNITVLARIPYCFILLAVIGTIIYFVWNRTRYAYNVRALGNGRQIAVNIGINVRKTRLKAFLVQGVILGIATVVSLSMKGAASATLNMGTLSVAFDAIMGVFIGIYLSKYANIIIAIFIGTYTIKMLSAGLLAIGLNSNLQIAANGLFLLAFIGISANQEKVFERRRFRQRAMDALAKQS